MTRIYIDIFNFSLTALCIECIRHTKFLGDEYSFVVLKKKKKGSRGSFLCFINSSLTLQQLPPFIFKHVCTLKLEPSPHCSLITSVFFVHQVENTSMNKNHMRQCQRKNTKFLPLGVKKYQSSGTKKSTKYSSLMCFPSKFYIMDKL